MSFQIVQRAQRFFLVEFAFALSACTPRPDTAPPPAVGIPEQPVVVAIIADAAPSEHAKIEITDDGGGDAPTEVVVAPNWSWLSQKDSSTPYSVSLSNGDWARSKVNALLDVSDAGLGITPAWFAQVNGRAESASEYYALAFHASNATNEEKIAVVLVAAENALALAKRLDDVGLSAMPKTWRTDKSLAVSFEDVAQGPSRRWRDEGLALVQLCIESAFELNVHDASTKKCQAIRKKEGTAVIRRAFARGDAGAQGCRCAPGDPLCSEPQTWCSRR